MKLSDGEQKTKQNPAARMWQRDRDDERMCLRLYAYDCVSCTYDHNRE